jgi:hypothetical protein
MLIKKLAHKITGRKCSRCRHNCAGRCAHPWEKMFAKCWNSLHRPGFEQIDPAEKETSPRPDSAQALTTEEEYQLQKIKAVLQTAEDDARESGLLEG